jgi:pimeloyl-ACP methyl ester carboxylesterase
MTQVREGTIEANGIRFAYLEAGAGPLVLLLHGFPDDARTWEHQLDALAGAGYRAVAPFLRGYGDTGPAPDGRYDLEALGADVVELLRALGGEPGYVVGTDWGASSAYAAMTLSPESIRRAVVMTGNHPATLGDVFLDPAYLQRLFHVWLLACAPDPAYVASAGDFALIDFLVDYWAPGFDDPEHFERVKRETLGREGGLAGPVAYYEELLNAATRHPEFVARATQPTRVPTLSLLGERDPLNDVDSPQEPHFAAPYRREIVAGAGHFLHRERPERVNELLLEWIGAEQPAAVA